MFITEPHPSFTDQPAPEDAVWRYMDLARYLSMLQRSALHFARADQMSDRWEGSFGKLNQELRPQLYGDDWATMAVAIGSRRAWFRERTHLNCWHLAQAESAAMWDIYQREGRGVAVRSSWGKLTSSLQGERMVYGARVRYVDYRNQFIPEGNAFDPFLFKRESFAHEKEVRLVMLTGKQVPGNAPEDAHYPESPVIAVPVALEQMVQCVYVAPDAAGWVAELVADVTARYGFGFAVLQSDLAQDPID